MTKTVQEIQEQNVKLKAKIKRKAELTHKQQENVNKKMTAKLAKKVKYSCIPSFNIF